MIKAIAFVAALAAVSIAAVSAHAGTIGTLNVSGTDDIFAATLAAQNVSTIPNDSTNSGLGSVPGGLTITPGEHFYITTSGLVFCCDVNGQNNTGPGTTAAGFASNPFGNGTNISDSLGTGYGNYVSSGAFQLLYAFTDASGDAIGAPAKLSWGTAGYVTAPGNATGIWFGFADANGFGGNPSVAAPAGFYSDNSGDIHVVVSSAPEPAAWLLMLLGVGFFGATMRARPGRRTPRELTVAELA